MAWNQEGPQRAVGVREILLHPYGDNRTYAFLDATSSLSFNPRFNSGELRGADSLAETAAIREALEWDFTAGGFDPDAYAVVYGVNQEDGGIVGTETEHKVLKIKVGENLPYFTIYAIASDDELGDHLVVLYRCKLTTDNTSGFSYGAFFTIGGSGLALPDPENDNNLMKLSTHSQRVNVYDESGTTYVPTDDDYGRYPYGFRESIVQRKFFSTQHYLTRFAWDTRTTYAPDSTTPSNVEATYAALNSNAGAATGIDVQTDSTFGERIFGTGNTKFIALPESFTDEYPDGAESIDYNTADTFVAATAVTGTNEVDEFQYLVERITADDPDLTALVVGRLGGNDINLSTLEIQGVPTAGDQPNNSDWVNAASGAFTYNATNGVISIVSSEFGYGNSTNADVWVRYRTNNFYVGFPTAQSTAIYYRVNDVQVLQIGSNTDVAAGNIKVYLTQSQSLFGARELEASEYTYIAPSVTGGVVTELGRLVVDTRAVEARLVAAYNASNPTSYDTSNTLFPPRNRLAITVGIENGTVTHYARLSSAENFTFTPVIGSAEQMGNDTITAANGRINNATAEFKVGGVDMNAQLIMFNKVFSVTGGTSADPDIVYTQPSRGGDTMPFFNLQGMSQANDAESTAIVEAPRAQTSADTDGFNDQEYQNNTISLNLLRWGRSAPTQDDQRVCLIYRNYKRFTNLPSGPQAYV